jgi:ABC-type branched-subunit amino acid transport system substrate-binding protein
MIRKLTLTLLALALAFAVGATAALAATARSTGDPGVTSTSILLGGTAPLTGPQSAYASIARGAKAYFDYVNSRGGVNGRRIEYTARDDASDPVRTVAETRRLVEQDGVFAVFNSFGTEQNLAVRDYLTQKKVPQLFAASGASALGSEPSRYPYTIGLRPTFTAEGWVLGQYLARTQGAAKVGVLYEADGFGQELLSGLRRGLQRSKVKIVSTQPYDVASYDVEAQVARLRVSGATVFAVFASPKHAAEALKYAHRLGWKPKLTVGNAASSSAVVLGDAAENGANPVVKGMVSVAFLKDPTDPRWLKDASMQLYRKVLKRFAPGSDASDVYLVYGMAAAWTAVEAIRRAGGDLTRERLDQVVGTLNLQGNPFLLPGISLKTGPGDRFPIDQMLLQRWQKHAWRSFGGVWAYRGGG